MTKFCLQYQIIYKDRYQAKIKYWDVAPDTVLPNK
jgi:hypothetical protein